MSSEHEAMLQSYPEARQLFGSFGEDYDYQFDKSERLAIDDYIDGRARRIPQALAELDVLLARFPDNDSMRAALFHLGVKWTMWDQNGDWVPFVRRVRGWLVESQTYPQTPRP